jgi:hypothetical protein
MKVASDKLCPSVIGIGDLFQGIGFRYSRATGDAGRAKLLWRNKSDTKCLIGGYYLGRSAA